MPPSKTAKRPKKPAGTKRKEPTVEIVTMTPEWAEELLAKNEHNRRLRQPRVQTLTRVIQTGEWSLNGDSIRTTHDGKLLDGQHRLAAIVEAGQPVKTVLFVGADYDDQLTIDVGAARLFADVLSMKGIKSSTVVAATTRLLAQYEILNGDMSSANTWRHFSQKELMRILEANPDLEKGVNEARRAYYDCKIPNSVLGLLYVLAYRIDPVDCVFFFDKLRTGIGLRNDDRTASILKLRQWSMGRKTHERYSTPVLIGSTFKAWNHFREGRTAGSVVYRAGGAMPEPFPRLV